VTGGKPGSPGKLAVGIIDMAESPVKFPSVCGTSWMHYNYLLTGMVELPNYDITLLRNERSLVTDASSESPRKLAVGIVDMPESLVKSPGGCGASRLHYHYLLSEMVELLNYDIAVFRNG
jgi:hypothetical protein